MNDLLFEDVSQETFEDVSHETQEEKKWNEIVYKPILKKELPVKLVKKFFINLKINVNFENWQHQYSYFGGNDTVAIALFFGTTLKDTFASFNDFMTAWEDLSMGQQSKFIGNHYEVKQKIDECLGFTSIT